MSLSHRKLIKCIRILGYPINEAGMCYGFAIMGMQAFLANDLETFNARLRTIASIPLEDFKRQIEAVEKKRMDIIEQYKKKLQAELKIKGKLDQEAWDTVLKINKDTKEVKDYLKKLHTINDDPQFSPTEKDLLTVRPFLEGLTLYFFPEKFPYVFDEKFTPKFQNAELTFARGLPLQLIQKKEEKDAKSGTSYLVEEGQVIKIQGYTQVLMSKTDPTLEEMKPDTIVMVQENGQVTAFWIDAHGNLQNLSFPESAVHEITTMLPKQPGESSSNANLIEKIQSIYKCPKIDPICGAYNEMDLKKYLSILSDNHNKDDPPITLLLTDHTHVITLLYRKENGWTLIDANKPLLKPLGNDISKVASKVLSSLSPVFSTEVYSTKFHNVKTKAWLRRCKATPEWRDVHSIKINPTNNLNLNLFWIAAQNNHLSCLKTLLEEKMSPNIVMNNNITCLYIASQFGHVETVEMLINHPAILPNKSNTDNLTPLFVASQLGFFNIVELLLKHKDINPNSITIHTKAPLHTAAQNGHLKTVNALLSHPKINPNITTSDHRTPLFVASQMGHVEIVRALLLHPETKIDIPMEDGRTPLFIASEMGHADVMRELIQHRARVNLPIRVSIPVLFETAAQKGRQSKLETLLLKNHNMSIFTPVTGFTPLHAAVFYGHIDSVKILIDAGASIDEKAGGKIRALNFAMAMGHFDIADLLRKKQLDDLKAEDGSPKQLAIQTLHTFLKIPRDKKWSDEKLTIIAAEEFDQFIQLNRLIEKLLDIGKDHDRLSALCIKAYRDYQASESKDKQERTQIFTTLIASVTDLSKKIGSSSSPTVFLGAKHLSKRIEMVLAENIPKKSMWDTFIKNVFG